MFIIILLKHGNGKLFYEMITTNLTHKIRLEDENNELYPPKRVWTTRNKIHVLLPTMIELKFSSLSLVL